MERYIIDLDGKNPSAIADVLQVSSSAGQNTFSSNWETYAQMKRNGLAQAIQTYNNLK